MSDINLFSEANIYTKKKLDKIRKELLEKLENSAYKDSITLIATGSYGRSEASSESDLDWFLIYDNDLALDAISEEIKIIQSIISTNIPNDSGDSKTFGSEATVSFNEMKSNIGGQHDTNENLTRRLLFLLEGTWLYGETRFNDYRHKLLEKYIKPDVSTGQLPYFFLNDVIRYYRTMATDFEYKVVENGKSWGLRNIKLRYSRKLLYFGGVIAIAEISGLERDEKLLKSSELFDKNTLERIKHLGSEISPMKTEAVFNLYNLFLIELSKPAVRDSLKECTKEIRNQCSEYVKLRDASELFSKALHEWLIEKYPIEHSIHHALIF